MPSAASTVHVHCVAGWGLRTGIWEPFRAAMQQIPVLAKWQLHGWRSLDITADPANLFKAYRADSSECVHVMVGHSWGFFVLLQALSQQKGVDLGCVHCIGLHPFMAVTDGPSGSSRRRVREWRLFYRHWKRDPWSALSDFYLRCGLPATGAHAYWRTGDHQADQERIARLDNELLRMTACGPLGNWGPMASLRILGSAHDPVAPITVLGDAFPETCLQSVQDDGHAIFYTRPAYVCSLIYDHIRPWLAT